MRFRTTIELGGKTATGFEVPESVVAALGSGKRAKVIVVIGGHTYRSSIATYDSRSFVPLSPANREAAGLAAGDDVEVELSLDTAPREIAVPEDVAAALAIDPAVRAAFDAFSYSERRRHIEGIEAAKKPEIRASRIEKAVDAARAASVGRT